MHSETQKDTHWKEEEAGGNEDVGHGESIKMDLETEDYCQCLSDTAVPIYPH